MNIEFRKLEDVFPYPNNPRVIDASVDAVANSIKEFGFSVPIVLDKNGVIVTGHTRYKAAQKLGLKEVPCYVAENLTEEQAQAYRLADNKVAELSIWDNNKLTEELMGLVDSIDMSLFGFEAAREELPEKEEESFSNVEFSIQDFEEDKFKHQCEKCGFKWN